jgi:polar amino acid transport system ATP-binding protein
MENEIILELENVTKYYNNELILDSVNLKVKKGEVIALIGKSGGGKSTLLKCINKMEKINSGKIKYKGIDINEIELTNLRQKIGIVFQDYNLFSHLTVLENLTIGLIKIKQYSKEKSIQKALKILKKVDLYDKKDKYPDELSGGQKQRVSIARTLLMKPKIIMLDEPTSALDREMKQSVIDLIQELAYEGMTIIIVSHEEEFVNKISNKIYEIRRKKIKKYDII